MTHTIHLYYFPKGLRYATPAFWALAAYLVLPGYWVISLILIAVSIFILTAKYLTIIDLQQKEFTDAFGFYGIQVNSEKKKYNYLEKIILTKAKYNQQLNSRARSSTMQWTEYTATLVYDNHQQLDLVSREDKGDVVEFAKVYSHLLKVPIQDLSVATEY